MRDGSGRLDPNCETAFGEYLFGMCGSFERRGCPVYGFGLQNGPTTTMSCAYDRESYYHMFKTLCLLKVQHGYQGKLLATEDECFLPNKVRGLVGRTDLDEQTKSCMEILAVRGNIDTSWHSLMWARRANPSAKLKNLYDYIYGRFFDLMAPASREAWVIQSCGEAPQWMPVTDYTKVVSVRDSGYMIPLPTGAMDLALKICSAMNSGFNSYVYWLASTVPAVDGIDPDLKDPLKALCDKGNKTIKYHATKHFFKYVLPGMTRIGASSEDMSVSAFKSDKLVIVAINDGNSIVDTCVEIAGADVGRCTSYTSVENEFHHQESGTVSGNKFPFTMLPRSIVTFVMD
jgi:O-glycosyl hydrolase